MVGPHFMGGRLVSRQLVNGINLAKPGGQMGRTDWTTRPRGQCGGPDLAQTPCLWLLCFKDLLPSGLDGRAGAPPPAGYAVARVLQSLALGVAWTAATA